MELEEKLVQATSKTFSKFTELLAKVDPVAALLITGAAIVPVIGSAFVVEMLNQQELLRSSGVEAVKAYNAMGAKGAIDLVAKGVAGLLPSEALNTIGQGVLAMVVLPLTACVSTLVAGRFQSLKDEIRTLEQGGRNIEPSQIKRVSYQGRETCATKLSAPERFDQSIEALSRKIEMIQNTEMAQQPKGPKP